MAQPRLIIGDMHARRSHVANVLRQAGALRDGKKNPDIRVTSLGDAVSLGYDEPEAEFLQGLTGALLDPRICPAG